ncbi:MAG: 16S rRNA (guanine(527)-N(7))-methyltransferase RsmG [Rhodospirillaceae bacterium]
MSAGEMQRITGVSHETLGRLEAYLDLLVRWQRRINLVGPKTLGDPWRRHFLDSAQLIPHLSPQSGIAVDIGSGAGFPGLVLALCCPDLTVHLFESDGRKAAFLREAARVTETNVTIHNARAESIAPFAASFITARAFAPLPKLLDLAWSFVGPETKFCLLKGQSVDDELTDSHKIWMMHTEKHPSLSDSAGCILILGDVHRDTKPPVHR